MNAKNLIKFFEINHKRLKYTLEYKCKCGHVVRIQSDTKALLKPSSKSFLYQNGKECTRNSIWRNYVNHKYIKTITKNER